MSFAAALKAFALCSLFAFAAVVFGESHSGGRGDGGNGDGGDREGGRSSRGRSRADGECRDGGSKKDMFPLAYVDGTIGIKGLQGVADSRPYAAEGKVRPTRALLSASPRATPSSSSISASAPYERGSPEGIRVRHVRSCDINVNNFPLL